MQEAPTRSSTCRAARAHPDLCGRPVNAAQGTHPGPVRIDSATKQRMSAAAKRARIRYPGAVGELLSQELLSWMVFGHPLGSSLIMRVVDEILLDEPAALPDRPEAAAGTDLGSTPCRRSVPGDAQPVPSHESAECSVYRS